MNPAIVLGSSRTVWSDLHSIPKWIRDKAVWFAVNDMIVFAPKVHHAVSLHRHKLPHWLALRTQDGSRVAKIVSHSGAQHEGVDKEWPQHRRSGSSSLFAARVAVEMGHAPVLLVGVSLDNAGHMYDDPFAKVNHGHDHFRQSWVDAKEELRRGQVFALSGFLQELLGEW